MTVEITIAKERQKFSAAHFTLFEDGRVERLHGHDYHLAVTFMGDEVAQGILIPFDRVKPVIQAVCDALDERVLVPHKSSWVEITQSNTQTHVHVRTPKVAKDYSFPTDEVSLLPCTNVSCENLVQILLDELRSNLATLDLRVRELEIVLTESAGQSVRARGSMNR